MSSNRPPVAGAVLFGPDFLTEADVVRRRQAKEKAARQREAPVVPRRIWHDRDMARACWLSGCGLTNSEIASVLGSTEMRIGGLLRGLGLRSRNTADNRLVQVIVPKGVHKALRIAAGRDGSGLAAFMVGAAMARAVDLDPADPMEAIRTIAPGAEAPAATLPDDDDKGPLLGDPHLPADQAAALDATFLRMYSPATAKRRAQAPAGPKGRA